MLKKRNRLTTKEFTKVFVEGEKKSSQHFLFIKQAGHVKKVSVAISKKVEKKAVNRVKSRRIVYKVLQENFNQISASTQAIFLITKPILSIDQVEIKAEILKFFVEN